MSFQATRFILGLTDLNSSQKAVAHTLAYHANKDGGNSYPSMETIARESGLQERRSAQRIVRQLEKKRIIVAMTAKTGGRGQDKATVYRLDLNYKSPINSDTTVALSDQQTATPGSQFTVEKQRPVGQESATPETIKRDIQGRKQRRPGRTNSTEELRRVCEEDDQEPHTTSLTNTMEEKEKGEIKPNQTSDSLPSKNNTLEGKSREIKPDQTSLPPQSKNNITPNRHVQGSKKEFAAAPEVARLQAEILRIQLSNGRTFQCNGKLNAIIGEELRKGRSAALILQAANYIGRALPDRDQIPGLTLADNLAGRIIAMELEQAAAVEEQERQARAARDMELEERRRKRIKAALIEQEEEVGREYKSWKLQHPDAPAEAFFPSDMHPSVFERYRLAERLKIDSNMVTEKILDNMRREAESPTILASVGAQLAAEGDGEPEPFY